MKFISKISLVALICMTSTSLFFGVPEQKNPDDFFLEGFNDKSGVVKKLYSVVQDIELGKIAESDIKARIDEQLSGLKPNELPGETPLNAALWFASLLGKINAVRTLIRLGAQNVENRALIDACKAGHPEVVAELLKITKNVNQKTRDVGFGDDEKYYQTPLQFMFPLGGLIIDYKLKPMLGDKVESMPAKDIQPMMHEQTKLFYVPIVQQLIKAGADLEVREYSNYDRTPLMIACQERNLPMIDALINAGADVNAQDSLGDTALMFICRFSDLDQESMHVIHKLLAAKADPNKQNENEYTPLMALSSRPKAGTKKGQIRILVLALVKAGADIEKEVRGWTALTVAAHFQDTKIFNGLEVFNALIEAGADIDKKLNNGNTELMTFAQNCRVDQINLFVQHKANLNIQDNDGNTVLMKAVSCDIDSYTVGKGQKEGHEKRVKSAESLIKAGADVRIKNKKGQTALDVLREKQQKEKSNESEVRLTTKTAEHIASLLEKAETEQ